MLFGCHIDDDDDVPVYPHPPIPTRPGTKTRREAGILTLMSFSAEIMALSDGLLLGYRGQGGYGPPPSPPPTPGASHHYTLYLSEDPSLTTCFSPGRDGVGGWG